MPTGTIERLEYSHGFIKLQGGGRLFFYKSKVASPGFGQLRKGDKVEYKTGTGRDGRPAAVNVKKIVEVGHPAAEDTRATPDYRFRNPYNFVRFLPAGSGSSAETRQLGRMQPPSQESFEGLCGTIECTYKTITPLFIAGKVEELENRHKELDFFTRNEQPLVPASSLRGMVRSLFETITNSCLIHMHQDGDDHLEYRLSRDPGLIPARVIKVDVTGAELEKLDCSKGAQGVLRCGLYKSYDPVVCNRRAHVTFHTNLLPPSIKNGDRVAAIVSTGTTRHQRGQISYSYYSVREIVPEKMHGSLLPNSHETVVFGYMKITGPNIEKKHDERLFFDWNDTPANSGSYCPKPVSISSKSVDKYNHSVRKYFERHKETLEELERARWPENEDTLPFPSSFVKQGERLKPGDLVYLNQTSQEIFPVAMPRQAYQKAREELLPDHLKPCDDAEKLCPACRLFGWVKNGKVEKNEQSAWAGRLQFFDGEFSGKDLWHQDAPFALAILGSPKPTATYMYLLDCKGEADFRVDYDARCAQLRGRKYYWHQGMKAFRVNPATSRYEWKRVSHSPNDVKDKSNVTLKRVIDEGKTFTFMVRYENLQPVELGALIWALQLEPGWHHRLGLAKPLGFGSLKCEAIKINEINRQTRYASLEADGVAPAADMGNQYVIDFKNAMKERYHRDFSQLDSYQDLGAILADNSDLPVHYPRPGIKPIEKGEQFKWFVGNKRPGGLKQPLSLALEDKGFKVVNEHGDIQER